ncbi:unnamed protein product [Owenia fusiformis]|uniref:Uncharacterized protein n=1 Tax=Owenia fusiformis TaxID=6347 RepID=A0A8S4N222_OWEFU|nr:unnamed protein product [Owenia fusiformis]
MLLMHDVYYENAPPYISNIFNLYRNKRPTRALRKTPHFIVPAKQSEKTRRGTVVSSISEWERDTLPDQLKTIPIKRTFKYHLKKHLFPKKTLIDTVHLNLDRQAEIVLNKTRCDFIFRYHKFQHQFNNVNPQCLCGFRSQTTQHLFFSCPLLLDLREQLALDLAGIPNFNINHYNKLNAKEKLDTLLYGGSTYKIETNKLIVTTTANFISLIVDYV